MKIIRINPENAHLFNNINRENATILFYHPSCIHCMMMRKNWETMKDKLQKNKKNCSIYEVNGEHIGSIQHPIKDKIQGFPTIMNVKNGKLLNYFEKERNIENMLNYVLENKNKNSSNKLKTRKVTFSRHPNGSLLKSRAILNANKIMNSISLKKKQNKSKKKKGTKSTRGKGTKPTTRRVRKTSKGKGKGKK